MRDAITYEGQAAIELEQRADEGERGRYPLPVEEVGPVAPVVLDARPTVRAVVEDLRAGAGVGRISARFHNGLAAAVVRSAVIVRERTGLGTVALSGGVYQNVLLLRRILTGLENAGFAVLTHRQVPPNDGGISLGQAAVAAARTAAGSDG